ncbi:uncharacterized protein G2W53_016353 [Senna tora]|uniref:Uncharacterized protein n=1 Tax=Senna tora TaxID=362788 RepID=A0A834TPA0_9FABA|nr:uncharacterized protein G2W53_016353 [Senna tora]
MDFSVSISALSVCSASFRGINMSFIFSSMFSSGAPSEASFPRSASSAALLTHCLPSEGSVCQSSAHPFGWIVHKQNCPIVMSGSDRPRVLGELGRLVSSISCVPSDSTSATVKRIGGEETQGVQIGSCRHECAPGGVLRNDGVPATARQASVIANDVLILDEAVLVLQFC